ncbi:MAG: hypothetical protein Q8R37_00470 [Nanoarchaeota archaeon]|nr:hypothetical protein [Nanoarchaeota archaeon]
MPFYQKLIDLVKQNPSKREDWLVLADKLQEDGNPHGEAIAIDLALREFLDARQTLRDGREKVWKEYGWEDVPDYFMQDKFWMGTFPLQFPNKERLNGLNGTFAEDFPHYQFLPEINTYPLGVHQLQQFCEQKKSTTHPTFTRVDGTTIYRPLTFKENMLARVEDYWTLYSEMGNVKVLYERLRLFHPRLDSCTGIVHKADSPEFKIILQSPRLISINEDFNGGFIPIDYDALQGDGIITLNINHGVYNQRLTQHQVLRHPAWNIVVEEDKALLKEYSGIVFSRQEGKNMSFTLRENVMEDQLRALFVSNLNNSSDAYDYINLINNSSLLAKQSIFKTLPKGS